MVNAYETQQTHYRELCSGKCDSHRARRRVHLPKTRIHPCVLLGIEPAALWDSVHWSRARAHTPPRRRLFPRNFCDVTFFTLRTIPPCSAARTCVLCERERERKFSDSTDLEHIMNLPLLLLRTTLPGTYLFISGGSGKKHTPPRWVFSSLGLQQ